MKGSFIVKQLFTCPICGRRMKEEGDTECKPDRELITSFYLKCNKCEVSFVPEVTLKRTVRS